MKKSIIITAAFLVTCISFGQKKKDLINEVAKLKKEVTQLQSKLDNIEKAKEINLENDIHNFSYAFGVSIGNNLKTIGFDSLSYHSLSGALEDVLNGKEKMNLNDAQKKVQETIKELQEKEAEEKSAEGQQFLAENGKRAGVVTTESGLQYEVTESGDPEGTKPTASSNVTTHYTGQLLDGTVFDSSVQRGQPATFPVGGVIAGWTEALQLMVPGDKWKLYIPFNLAYGEKGAGKDIPPFATLIFEIELLSVA